MSGSAASAAAAARREAIARVLDAFRVADATAPERAQPLAALGLAAGGPTEVLQASGVLKPGAAPDAWYLDEAAYVAERDAPAGRSRRTMVLLVAAVLLAILVIGFAIVMRGGPRPG